MKKNLLTAIAVLLAHFCFAQSGKIAIGIGAEFDPLANQSYSSIYKAGFGGNLKGLYGVGSRGQITLTAGYLSFGGKSGVQYGDQTLSLIPVLAGYRYNFEGGLYGELQAGMGSLTTKASGFSFNQTNFAAALNIGYVYNNFDFSARYYTEGDVISMFALRIGYNFSIK